MLSERRRSRPLLPLLILAVAVLSGACVAAPGAAGPQGGVTRTGAVPPSQAATDVAASGEAASDVAAAAAATNVAKVRAAIDAADLADPATIDAVDAVRWLDGAATAAAAAIRAGVTGDALWAATWVYTTTGTDPKPLRPLLKNADASIRALAAAAILSWGDRSGAKVLSALLLTEGVLAGSIPPAPIADYAAGSLRRYINGPRVAADASREAVAAAWKAWLAKNGSRMTYSKKTGKWSAK